MKLSTPKNITFYISAALAILAFLGYFIDAMTVFAPWMMLVAFVILAAGNLLEGL